jgi:hypothetical protein
METMDEVLLWLGSARVRWCWRAGWQAVVKIGHMAVLSSKKKDIYHVDGCGTKCHCEIFLLTRDFSQDFSLDTVV